MITSPSTNISSKYWSFVTTHTLIIVWVPKNIVVVNKAAFDSLDISVQNAILEAAQKAEKHSWEMSRSATDERTKF